MIKLGHHGISKKMELFATLKKIKTWFDKTTKAKWIYAKLQKKMMAAQSDKKAR